MFRFSFSSLVVAVLAFANGITAQDLAWAWVRPIGQPTTFTPDPAFSYSSSGGAITVTRDSGAPYRFHVEMEDMAPIDGVPLATAYGGSHSAVVRRWTSSGTTLRVTVELWEPDGTPASDEPFVVTFRRGGRSYLRSGYAAAMYPTSASYTVLPIYAYNAAGGSPWVTRFGSGVYRVTFPGLGALGIERGHCQAAAIGPERRHVTVDHWTITGADLEVLVHVRDFDGNFADGRFALVYDETAATTAGHLGSGAHLAVSGSATNPVLLLEYTDSNGSAGPLGQEQVERLGTGYYRVHLPNMNAANATIAQATSIDSGPYYASIHAWYSNWISGGTYVFVKTFDSDGVQKDARFALRYLSNQPAGGGTPASNTVVGSGCHGLTLQPQSTPIIGTTWEAELLGMPASHVLAFAQLGLSNPSSPVPGATSCTAYTDGLATSLLIPFVNPAIALALPDAPSLIGLELYAQAGAFVPGINPLGLAASNAVRGFVGDR